MKTHGFLITTPTSWSYWTRYDGEQIRRKHSFDPGYIVSDDLRHIIVKNNCLRWKLYSVNKLMIMNKYLIYILFKHNVFNFVPLFFYVMSQFQFPSNIRPNLLSVCVNSTASPLLLPVQVIEMDTYLFNQSFLSSSEFSVIKKKKTHIFTLYLSL